MSQFIRNRNGRVSSPRPVSSRVPAAVVCVAAMASSVAHGVAAAVGPGGAMAWWMAAMGVACLACAIPVMFGRHGVSSRQSISSKHSACRAAGHLWAMNAAMILIHLALLLFPVAGVHHGGGSGGGYGVAAAPVGGTAHGVAMLGLIAVELLCLACASVALRLTRVAPSLR